MHACALIVSGIAGKSLHVYRAYSRLALPHGGSFISPDVPLVLLSRGCPNASAAPTIDRWKRVAAAWSAGRSVGRSLAHSLTRSLAYSQWGKSYSEIVSSFIPGTCLRGKTAEKWYPSPRPADSRPPWPSPSRVTIVQSGPRPSPLPLFASALLALITALAARGLISQIGNSILPFSLRAPPFRFPSPRCFYLRHPPRHGRRGPATATIKIWDSI